VSSTPVVEVGGSAAEIETLVAALQRAVVEHPVAAQGLAAALIAEGRRFAETPAGAEWLERLAASELARQARVFWESSTLNMIDERADPPLPSAFVDAVLGAMMSQDLEGLLARTNPMTEGNDE
jgi:hypothetical protein